MTDGSDSREKGGASAGQAAPKATRRLALHSLDALRGFMLLTVVLGHLAVSFGVNCPPGWKACDNSSTYLVSSHEKYVFDLWGLTMVAACIPVFFMLAGLYAMVAYKKLGAVGFLANRLKMIVLPFFAACVLILPLNQLAGLYGDAWRAAPGSPKADFAASVAKFYSTSDFLRYFALGHLWFLYYLILCYAIFVATAPLWDPLLRSDRFRKLARAAFDSPLRVLWLAVPVALLKLPSQYMVDTHAGWGWGAFVPEPDILALYFIFFLLGGVLARQPVLIPSLWRRWAAHLALGLFVALPACLLLLAVSAQTSGQFEHVLRTLKMPEALSAAIRPLAEGVGGVSGIHLLLVFVYSIYTWLLIFGIFGLFNRFFGRRSRVIRYVVDTSYWLYLVHFPLIITLQVVTQDIQLPSVLKYVLLVIVTLVILFGTFELLVRPTPLGRLLGVRRRARSAAA